MLPEAEHRELSPRALLSTINEDENDEESLKSEETEQDELTAPSTQSSGEETEGNERKDEERYRRNKLQEEQDEIEVIFGDSVKEKLPEEGKEEEEIADDEIGISSHQIAQDSVVSAEEDIDKDDDDKEEDETGHLWWNVGMFLLVSSCLGISGSSTILEEKFSSTHAPRPLNRDFFYKASTPVMNDTNNTFLSNNTLFPSLIPSLNQSNHSSLSPSPSLSEFIALSIAPSSLPLASASNPPTPTPPSSSPTNEDNATSNLFPSLMPSLNQLNLSSLSPSPSLSTLTPNQLTGEPSAKSMSAMPSQPTLPPSSSPTNEDNATPLEMNILQGHTDIVHCIVYSPDGKHIASGSSDNTTKIWNATSDGPPIRTLEGHTDWVVTAAYSPDGNYLATGSWDTTIKIWNATEGESAIRTLRYHTETITTVAYSPDGLYIASASLDGVIYIWHSTEGEEPIFMLKGDKVAFYGNGSHIANCSETGNYIDLWQFEDGFFHMGAIEYEEDDYISSFAISPNGYFASGFYDHDTIKVSCWGCIAHNVSTFALHGHKNQIISMAFGRLLNSDTIFLASASLDDTIKLWDLDNKTNFQTINATGVTSVTCSTNATHIAWGSDDNTIKVLKL